MSSNRVCSRSGVIHRKPEQSGWLHVALQPGSAAQVQAGRSEEVGLTEAGGFKEEHNKAIKEKDS